MACNLAPCSFAALGSGTVATDSEGNDIPTLSYSLIGGSVGSYVFDQAGGVYGEGGGSFAHLEAFTENTTVNIVSSNVVNLNNTGDSNVGGFNYSNYRTCTSIIYDVTDNLKGHGGGGNFQRAYTVTSAGTGGGGTITINGNGSASVNGRGASYVGTAVAPMGLVQTPVINYQTRPVLATALNVDQHFTLAPSLGGIGDMLDALVTPAMLGGQMASPNPTTPVMLAANFRPGDYSTLVVNNLHGQLLSPTALTLNTANGWMQSTYWAFLAGVAFNDVLERVGNLQQRQGMTMYGKAALEVEVAMCGGVVTGDIWTNIGGVFDFLAGVASVATAGLSNRFLNDTPFGLLVDMQSTAFALGQIAGAVLMNFLPGGAVLNMTITAMQVAGNVWNAVDAFRAGDTMAGITSAGFAIIAGGCLLKGSGLLSEEGKVSTALGYLAEGGRVAGQIMGAVSVGTNVGTGLAKLISGDTKGALLSLGQAAADFYSMTRACFVAGTMVLVRRGRRVLWMRIEDIRPGDQVWSKPEGNANAPGEWKEVQETFVRVAPITELGVGGHTIGTTWEHPIFIRRKGWLPAGEVQVGDQTLGKDGEWTTVDAVRSTGRVETVHNFRVADYHTYFVGGEEWAFSVWAHNSYGVGERVVLSKSLTVNKYLSLASNLLRGYGWKLSWAAARLGVYLKDVRIVNGTAHVSITGASEFRRSDIRTLLAHLRNNGASTAVVNSGGLLNNELRLNLLARSAAGKPAFGAEVVHIPKMSDLGRPFDTFQLIFRL